MFFAFICFRSLFGLMFFRRFSQFVSTLASLCSGSLGALKVSPSMCLTDFQSGVLSKGREELADEDHDHHLRRDRGGTHTTGNHRRGGGGGHGVEGGRA